MLTIYVEEKKYFMYKTIIKHAWNIIKDNENSFIGFIIPEPKLDGKIKIDNLRHLLTKDINEKLWTVVMQRGRNKRGELYVKFRVYK